MGMRRRFVLGSLAAAGGLALGWSILPPRQRLTPHRAPRLPGAPSVFNGWVAIDSDGLVTVLMAKSEMGQGTHTGLAMLLAEELDADWARVRTASSGIDPIYNNIATVVDGLPFHPDDDGLVKRASGWMVAKLMREAGVMMTGGSSSLKDLWLPMRQAGASARAMLVAEAAQRWGVAAGEINVVAGRLEHASGRTAGFGELAEAAGRRAVIRDAPLKPASAFKLIGQPLHRLDTASKSDGQAGFGIDLVLPQMLHAAVRICPMLGGRVASFDATAAMQAPGVRKVFSVPALKGGAGALAVLAESGWQARRALDGVSVKWQDSEASGLSSDGIRGRLMAALDAGRAHTFARRGDVDAALKAAARTVSAEYFAPYLAHATLEPMNCTVQVKPDRATVWAPTQVPGLARQAVARVTGLDPEQIDIEVPYLGGGFGRRLEVDFIAQAAAIAMQAEGVPVKTIWSREDDMTQDFYRPSCVARIEAGLDASGGLQGWRMVSAGQSVVAAYAQRVMGVKPPMPDKTTSEGAFDQPYEFADARIAHVSVELPVPVGFWRAVGHSHQAFFQESFIDELAHAAGQDSLEFRLKLLRSHPRHARVLQQAARLGGWGQAIEPSDGLRRGRGIALHESFGSVVAQVAEVSVTQEGLIQVDRVACVIDCGLAINPELIRQQVDSAIVYGLSAALKGEITIENGQVQQRNFHDYPVLTMAQCPVIDTEIIASSEPPEGVGEPPLPPIAPAVANAVFSATGQRLRSLPLRLA